MTKKAAVTKEVQQWLDSHIEKNIEYGIYKNIPHLSNDYLNYANKIARKVLIQYQKDGIIDIGRPSYFNVIHSEVKGNGLLVKFTQVDRDIKINNIINEEN